jgi:hypothetical protein
MVRTGNQFDFPTAHLSYLTEATWVIHPHGWSA